MTQTNYVCFCKYSFLTLLAAASVLTSSQVSAHVLEFTVEPTDTVVEAGQKAVLDCVVKAAFHESSVLIEWLDQDGQKITFVGDLYRNQLTNGSLYINNVIEEQRLTGNYQCMASLPNVGKIISRVARLSIANLTGFLEEPSDNTVYIGQKAHFACSAHASPPPKIRWLKDERPLQLDELRMTILPSGALEVDEVLESDQGSYRCNASSLSSYKLSNKANLIINGDQEQAAHFTPPNFIAKPRSETVIEGQNISLDCAANGNPKPKVTWVKDGAVLDMKFLDSRFNLIGSTSSLQITNIQKEDAGTYQCRAQNREDSFDASAEIQVQVPPKFLKKPVDKIEYASKDVEFECSVYGIPEPKIQWFKNGEILTTNDYYQLVNGYNLKIMGLMTSDSALFQCFASNPAGNIQAAASLKVMPTAVRRNKHKNLKKFNPNKHDDVKPLDKNKSFNIFSSLKSEGSAKLGDVDFAHLSPNRGYMHDASVHYDPHSAFTSLKSSETNESNLGDILSAYSPTYPYPPPAESSEAGIIDGLPGAPQDLKATIVKARFVLLSWKPPSLNADNIEVYSVYYRQEGSERERVQNTTRSRMEDITIGKLQPGCVYYFRVVAVSKRGSGISSESLKIMTQPVEHVPSPPQSFTAYATSSRSIHVSWRPPETPNGDILRYTVYYMESEPSVEHNIETRELKYDLTGLSIYMEYNIWVVAVNQNGDGSPTEEKVVRTLSAPPSEPPHNISVEPSSSTSIMIRWEPPPPESQNGIITGYKLRYRKQGSKGVTTSVPANERVYTLTDLERGSVYQVKLWALNINGTSPPSEWYDIETFENDLDESRVPDEPGPLRAVPSYDKLYVMWTPPVNQNIKIRNYILAWGKGVPDLFFQELDAETRNYIIERLEPNCEYVLSLRASNQMGAGRPVYATVRTQEEQPPEPQPPLVPPVGLKAQILGPNSAVLYWTDITLSKTQYIRDRRYYIVKYTAEKTGKTRQVNATDLHVMITDLKPNTLYEFSVKLIKERKESPWSMIVTNTTWDLTVNTPPRDLNVHMTENKEFIELTWQPPKTPGGRITGYVILYTDNITKSDREWNVQVVKGDKHSAIIPNLHPHTHYHFKIQARNSRGYGPFCDTVSFKTGQHVGAVLSVKGQPTERNGMFTGTMLLYIIIAACTLVAITVAAVLGVLCCRRRNTTGSPDRSKKGYQKGTQNIKPPDLWIHHDQMELKALEKSHSNNDGASSSGAMTLPRSVGGNDYDAHNAVHSNSLDKRNYVPSYAGVTLDDKNKRVVKPKPISLPVDSKPPREPIATPINTTSLSQSSSDSTPSSRPAYPRTNYSMPRAHVTIDSPAATAPENPYSAHQPPHTYEGGTPGYTSQPPQVAHLPPGSAYAPGLSVLAESQGGKRIQGQCHPLKSFTVPAPPPISAPSTPQPKHIGFSVREVSQPQVTVRPNSSPFKKAPTSSSSTLTSTPPSRISASNPPPHTAEELQKLQPSHSTEELNQEMANLEGLMLTLNAITANEFEC